MAGPDSNGNFMHFDTHTRTQQARLMVMHLGFRVHDKLRDENRGYLHLTASLTQLAIMN